MAWRRALVFRKSSSKSMPRGRGRAARRAILRGRQARISLGSRTSTTWPAWQRSTRRKARWAIRRRTAQRAGLVERRAPRASQAMEPGPSFEAAVPQEMRIDGAVRDGQAQPGNEMVFELFPDLCDVG